MESCRLTTRCAEEAALIMGRLEALAALSDEPGRLTRWFASPAMASANRLVGSWMHEAGLDLEIDGWGNLIGSTGEARQVVLLGSHLDTVRNAGKYDGPLGVLLGITAVKLLGEFDLLRELPWRLEVAGFSDEEGLRFQATYLGSRALLGRITEADLALRDADGIPLGSLVTPPDALPEARYAAGELAAYLEVHIEQGPVLEAGDHAIGIVTGIAGQTRARAAFLGRADHAGTCPMNLRRDALPAAAELVLAAEALARETPGLVATVGQVYLEPGASNVVPSEARLSLDIRHLDDANRSVAVRRLEARFREIAAQRGLACEWQLVQEGAAVRCDSVLADLLARSAEHCGIEAPRLPSGAGHDAAVMAQVAPAAMLFVRSPGGISHHPDEAVLEPDVAAALEVLVTALRLLPNFKPTN